MTSQEFFMLDQIEEQIPDEYYDEQERNHPGDVNWGEYPDHEF